MSQTKFDAEKIRAALVAAGRDVSGGIIKAVEALANELIEARREAATIPMLMQRAAEGETFRANVIEAAIAEGYRAFGYEFEEDGYRKTLDSLPLTTIAEMAADWGMLADRSGKPARKPNGHSRWIPPREASQS